ncbi:hypothetical protein C0J52_00149 [Blattella germanica]|nr:hypothetical protein C0J52_00149 [Blattella germanica]
MPLKVDQCCCGCTLRTGTILIGTYYIISSCAVLAVCTMGIIMLKDGDNNGTAEAVNVTEHYMKGRGNRHDLPSLEYTNGIATMFLMFSVSSTISVLLNCMLLLGTRKGNIRLIYIWIVAHVIYLVVSVVGLLTNMFMSLLNPSERVGSVGTSLMSIVLTFYFLVVVGSYYQQLKDRQTATLPGPVVVYIDHQSGPPPYSELYPPWPEQQQQQVSTTAAAKIA